MRSIREILGHKSMAEPPAHKQERLADWLRKYSDQPHVRIAAQDGYLHALKVLEAKCNLDTMEHAVDVLKQHLEAHEG